MTFRRFIPTLLGAAIAVLVGAGAVQAQEPGDPAPPTAPREQVEVTDELLQRFVDIYPQVLETSQRAQADLATAADAEEAQAIQARAEESIMAVLEEEEMSQAEYQAVVLALRDDEALRQTFTRMLQESRAEPGA